MKSPTTQNDKDNKTERFERFVSLTAGQYWQALKSFSGKHIDEGEILLINNIDFVDDMPHTIEIYLHPSKQDHRFENSVAYAKFLTNDFLTNFQHVPEDEAKRDRDAYIKGVQDEITSEQVELQKACADPHYLDLLIVRDSPKKEEKKQLPANREKLPSNVVHALQGNKVTELMTTGLTQEGIEVIKSEMIHQQEVMQERSKWITNKSTSIASISKKMTPVFRENAAAMVAATSQMRKHLDELMKGIESLDLYTLKDVVIESISKGCSAPVSEPLTLTQQVLYMDEEMAVYEPVPFDFDCQDREVFFNTLKSTPELVSQIFPTQRCVVAIATTRHNPDYERQNYNARTIDELSRENAKVFLLVRNGDNIHLVLSANTLHQYVSRLFPSQNDMSAPFTGYDGSTISFNDLKYTNSLSTFEEMALTYKRLLILLCGLDHNHDLFGEFYEGEKSLNFVSLDFQSKYFRFIYDDSYDNLLGGKERPSYRSWIGEMNLSITQGSRVLLNWRGVASPNTCSSAFEPYSYRWHKSDSERAMLYTPETDRHGYFIGIVKMEKGRFIVSVPVSGSSNYYDSPHREFNAKLLLDQAMSDADIADIVCIDCVDLDVAKSYLKDRNTRAGGVHSIRFLKSVIALISDEKASEAPIRHKLYSALGEGDIATGTDALVLIDKAIAKFRCTHKGEQLSVLIDSTKQFNKLLDQLYQLTLNSDSTVDAIRASEETKGRKCLRISVSSSGKYVAYSTPLPEERDDRLRDFVWQAKTGYSTNKSGIKSGSTSFASLVEKPAKETVLFEVDDIKDYLFPTNHPWSTYSAKARFLSRINPSVPAISVIKEAREDEEKAWALLVNYTNLRERLTNSKKGNTVETVQTIIPVGYHVYDSSPMVVSLTCEGIYILGYIFAAHPDMQKKAASLYSDIYMKTDLQFHKFLEACEKFNNNTFPSMSVCLYKPSTKLTGLNVFHPDTYQSPELRFENDPLAPYSYEKAIWRSCYNFSNVFGKNPTHAASILVDGVAGKLDVLLGVEEPENFEPMLVVTHDKDKKKTIETYELTLEAMKAAHKRRGWGENYKLVYNRSDFEKMLEDRMFVRGDIFGGEDIEQKIFKAIPSEPVNLLSDFTALETWAIDITT